MQFLSPAEVVARILIQLWPVWAALVVTLGASALYRRRLGLYGHVVGSGVGFAGLALILFWLFVAILQNWIVTFDPLRQIVEMKYAAPGAVEASSGVPYLLGGDKEAHDVFSRMIAGARIDLIIAPLATLLALCVGVALGLPAGYFGGRADAALSFLANLVLAFPAGGRTVKAVEAVSFVANEAEVVAIVGESGCGKSTFAKVALGLETASAGAISFDARPIQQTPVEKRDTATISAIQMIFQNPFDTLTPATASARRSCARWSASAWARRGRSGRRRCTACSTL